MSQRRIGGTTFRRSIKIMQRGIQYENSIINRWD